MSTTRLHVRTRSRPEPLQPRIRRLAVGGIAALALAGCGTDSNAAAGQLKRATSDVKSILNEHAIQYDHLRCAHVHGGLFHCQVVTFDDLSGDQTLQNVYVRDDGKTVTVTGLNA